ncbi:uncharacterized protein C8Q71DRAFT_180950 [Rhodofomes roseus]|uniref:Uncharacterized protein n=1 Tax=Rhodofomes roseus TaxID=34475 RepID=A0ABQ8K9D4_9APHY|nr:uncharacterized protein C8Q71DRAFT_180950 [Rhodofomes roseus]KAH9833397.1 hypothetical protein C8Q71DRAFT_180950 [Rhodofomes roseus]
MKLLISFGGSLVAQPSECTLRRPCPATATASLAGISPSWQRGDNASSVRSGQFCATYMSACSEGRMDDGWCDSLSTWSFGQLRVISRTSSSDVSRTHKPNSNSTLRIFARESRGRRTSATEQFMGWGDDGSDFELEPVFSTYSSRNCGSDPATVSGKVCHSASGICVPGVYKLSDWSRGTQRM